MIDRKALLATLKSAVTRLEASIQARIADTPEIAGHLKVEHHRAEVAERTAMSLEEWQDGEVTQAAVAWVLAGVFVRFLEDNRLIDQPLIAGPGQRGEAALGHRSNYFQRHPGHSDREYLEACFREVAAFPAVAPLYDERHNPLWRLKPTADGAKVLRETFTAMDPVTGNLAHDFSDPDLGTRFLGDLYQDLSEAAKKRYALLQTPEFVESFILDRTLTPAITEFGLAEVRLIDPTCGSGHFLIGAFHRLFALWQECEPGTTATVLAQRALDQIAGVDLNPYATAIARFRLIIAALKACSIARIAEAPAFELNLATGDSLLHGPLPFEGARNLFDTGRLDKNIAHVYQSEDADELKQILGRGYHAVVGNPPYITGDDAAQREAYRARYASCHREFALTVPFMERFFELAQIGGPERRTRSGFVGKITGNAFLRREFGTKLVREFLTNVDLQLIVDTSAAFIPGHGTPTVLVFGRPRQPQIGELRVVDALRTEGRAPSDPAHGAVWRSIVELADTPGAANEFVRTSLVDRAELLTHPVVLGPGRELSKAMMGSCSRSLGSVAVEVGYSGQTNIDDLMLRPEAAWRRIGLSEERIVPVVKGDFIRDWRVATKTAAWWPYDGEGLLSTDELGDALSAVWPWRTPAWERRTFNKNSYRAEGRPYYEWHQIGLGRVRMPRAVAWAFVATHNHFALETGRHAFKQSALFARLPSSATRDDYLGLIGVLNSSSIAFVLKQRMYDRGGGGIGGGIAEEAWERFYEFSAVRVSEAPIPEVTPVGAASAIDALGAQSSALLEDLERIAGGSLGDHLANQGATDRELARRAVSLQEELDWQVLHSYGLVPGDLAMTADNAPALSLGERAFEIVLARSVAAGSKNTTWFERHGAKPITEVPLHWPEAYRGVVERRIAIIESDPDVGLIEQPEHKRRWNRLPWDERVREALTALALDALEAAELWTDLRPRSTAELTDHLRKTPALVEALETLADDRDVDLGETVERLVIEAAVPHLAAQRLKESGLRKRAVWEQVWEQQRAEDRGDDPGRVPVPPKYSKTDMQSATIWKHRDKLDVPTERFVLIPNAQRGADASPVVGWAGWDELGLARALAGRITELRNEEAADAERLTSLLAGVLELLPWIHQWHSDSNPAFGGPPGTFLDSWLDGQLSELAVTRDTLRAWRPPPPTRGRRRATA